MGVLLITEEMNLVWYKYQNVLYCHSYVLDNKLNVVEPSLTVNSFYKQIPCIILHFLPNRLCNIAWACWAEMWTSSVCCPEGKWAWGPCGCGLMCAYMSHQRWTLLLPRPLRLQLTHLRLIHNHWSTNHAHLSLLYLNPSLCVWPRIIIRWLSLKRIL